MTPAVDWDAGTMINDDCNACHGRAGGAFAAVYGEPNYTEGVATSDDVRNSHSAHVSRTLATAKTQCADCHADAINADGTLKAGGTHLNGAVEVTFGAGKKILTYNPIGEACGTITCHGNGTASWGQKLGCVGCHGGGADVNNWAISDGTASIINTGAEWTSYGHGSTTAGTLVNLAQGKTGIDICRYCHDWNVGHEVATNPFRLLEASPERAARLLPATSSASLSNGDGVCWNCHGTGSNGVGSRLRGRRQSRDCVPGQERHEEGRLVPLRDDRGLLVGRPQRHFLMQDAVLGLP